MFTPTSTTPQLYEFQRAESRLRSDAPGTIRNAISLFEWARRKSYIPRVGKPPQESLGAILTIIHDNAETELTQLTAELVNVRIELTKLRMVNWRKVGIAEHPPKNPKS